jgi:hypothetical protein
MKADSLNISKIETYLNSILDGVVSENTFFTTYPDASIVRSSSWQDMLLVEIPSGIRDLEAMGKGYVSIGLYARPHESGKKNVAKMSEMETKLNDAIASSVSSEYMLVRDDAYATYDTDIDWHCNVISFILKVF